LARGGRVGQRGRPSPRPPLTASPGRAAETPANQPRRQSSGFDDACNGSRDDGGGGGAGGWVRQGVAEVEACEAPKLGGLHFPLLLRTQLVTRSAYGVRDSVPDGPIHPSRRLRFPRLLTLSNEPRDAQSLIRGSIVNRQKRTFHRVWAFIYSNLPRHLLGLSLSATGFSIVWCQREAAPVTHQDQGFDYKTAVAPAFF